MNNIELKRKSKYIDLPDDNIWTTYILYMFVFVALGPKSTAIVMAGLLNVHEKLRTSKI